MKTKLWHTSCRTSAIKPLWLMTVVLIVICHVSCSTTGKGKKPMTGKYCTHGPSWFRGKILQKQYHAEIWPMWLIHLYLRADGCFVAGTCDNQIWQAGRYKASGSSVTFYDVYDFVNGKNVPDHTVPYDSKRHQILFRYPNTYKKSNQIYPESIAPLEYDYLKGKLDFLRNEDWPLDSLYKYNIHWDRNKQHAWMDSMITVKHIKVVNGVVQ